MCKKVLSIVKLFIVSIFIVLVYIITKNNWENIKGEWIGFWGSIFGSILGGIVTLVALRKTIEVETITRNDDRRLQVIPYLQYDLLQNEPLSKLWRDIRLQPNIKIVQEVIKPGVPYKDDFVFYIDIENVGMNSAVNLSVLEIEYCGVTDYSYIDHKIMKVGEKIHLSFNTLVNYGGKLSINREDTGVQPVKIKLAYTDLLENYYEQDIKVDCCWGCTYNIDEKTKEKTIVYYDYYVSHGIKDISSPRYIRKKNIISAIDDKKKVFYKKNKSRKIISKVKNIVKNRTKI